MTKAVEANWYRINNLYKTMNGIKNKIIHWLGGYTKQDLLKYCDSVPVMSCMLRAKLKKLYEQGGEIHTGLHKEL